MKLGDVVKLKSGGPDMTVIADFTEYAGLVESRQGYWLCAFFEDWTRDPIKFWTHQDALNLKAAEAVE